MSEALDRAVDARLEAFRPDQTPPFGDLLDRHGRQRRRRRALLAVAPVLAAVLVAPVAWSAATGGDDELVQADSSPGQAATVAFGVHPVLDIARFNYTAAPGPPTEPTPGTLPGRTAAEDCEADGARGLPPETGEQPPGAFVACAYDVGFASAVGVYRLGPAAVTREHVTDVRAVEEPSGFWSVAMTLTPDGQAAFADLTGQAACAPPGTAQRRIAYVVDGEVVNGETSMSDSVDCGVGISSSEAAAILGLLDEAEARELARRITASGRDDEGPPTRSEASASAAPTRPTDAPKPEPMGYTVGFPDQASYDRHNKAVVECFGLPGVERQYSDGMVAPRHNVLVTGSRENENFRECIARLDGLDLLQ